MADDTAVAFNLNAAGLVPLAAFVGPPSNQVRIDLTAPEGGGGAGTVVEIQLASAGQLFAIDTKLPVRTFTANPLEHRWILTATGGLLAVVWIVFGRITAGAAFRAKLRMTFSECCGSGALTTLLGDGVV